MGLITVIWTAGMTLLMWVPLPPGPPSPLGHADLIIHFGLFVVFGYLTFHLLRPDDNPFYWLDWIGIVTVVGILLESGQYVIPGRSVQLLDYTVNLAGALGGAIACLSPNPVNRQFTGVAVGGFSLFVGFGTIFYGSTLFDLLLQYPIDVRLNILIVMGLFTPGIIAGRYGWATTWNTTDTIIVTLILSGIVFALAQPTAWSYVLLFSAIGVSLFLGNGDQSGVGTAGRTIFLVVYVFTILAVWVKPQQFLDGFGLLFVSAGLLVMGVPPLIQWFPPTNTQLPFHGASFD